MNTLLTALPGRRLARYVFCEIVLISMIGSRSLFAVDQTVGRSVRVEDLIGLTHVGVPFAKYSGVPPASFSPDGRQLVVITRRGDLANNSVIYTLRHYESEEAFASSKGEALVTIASTSNAAGIASVKWLNNDRLVFLGAAGNDQPQIYAVNARTKACEKLTECKTGIGGFAITANLDTMLYWTPRLDRPLLNPRENKSGLVVVDQVPVDLITNQYSEYSAPVELWLQKKSGDLRKLELGPQESFQLVDGLLSISPNGQFALVKTIMPIALMPEAWRVYEPFHGKTTRLIGAGYHLFDLTNDTVRWLIDAPTITTLPNCAWLPDSGSVIVNRTYLPIEGKDALQREHRRENMYLVEIEVKSGAIHEIASTGTIMQRGLDFTHWDGASKIAYLTPHKYFGEDEVITQHDAAYQKRENHWEEINGNRARELFNGRYDVQQVESMTMPPKLVLVDSHTHRQTELADLNPQLAELRLPRLAEFSWKSSMGEDGKCGLFYPLDYVPGRRYPLVIQTNGWNSRDFTLEGLNSTSGYVAMPLSAQGMFVAQIPESSFHASAQEGPGNRAFMDGLIDALNEQGLIEPTKLGIHGFSRTGYSAAYMLAFSKHPIAAALIIDTFYAGYTGYILNASYGGGATYEILNDAAPTHDGLKQWFEHCPLFNAERIHSPLLQFAYGPNSLTTMLAWKGTFDFLHKPEESVYLPDALHNPVKPSEQLAVQQRTVDWFRFWLKGEEDSDPAKAGQYARWRKLRELHEADLKAAAAEAR